MVFGLLFGLGGAFLGNLIGIGSSAGFLIGSFIYSLFSKKNEKIKGGALESLTVNTSSADAPIRRVYGTAPCGVNYIYPPKIDRITDKNGRERRYLTADMLLCEGPIIAFKRVFANDELIADFSGSTADGVEESTALFLKHAKFYKGNRSDPDPTILGLLGEGATYPTYPGYARIVLDKYPLDQFNGSIPEWRIEVVGSGESTPEQWNDVTPTSGATAFSARAQMGVIVWDPDGDGEDELWVVGGIGNSTVGGVYRTTNGIRWERVTTYSHQGSANLGISDFFNFTPVEWTVQEELAQGKVRRNLIILGGQQGTRTFYQKAQITGILEKWIVGRVYDSQKRAWTTIEYVTTTNLGVSGSSNYVVGGTLYPVDPMPRQNYGICNWIMPADTAFALGLTRLDKQVLVLTGGEVAFGTNYAINYPAGYTNGQKFGDCWVSANQGLSWVPLNCPTNGPWIDGGFGGYRINHTMVVWQGVPWVIGGKGDGLGGRANAVYKLDIDSRTFTYMGDPSDAVTPSIGQGGVWGAFVDEVTKDLIVVLWASGQEIKIVRTDGSLSAGVLVWEEISLSGAPTYTATSDAYNVKFAALKGKYYALGGEISNTIVNNVYRTDFPTASSNTIKLGTIYRNEAVTLCGMPDALVNTDDIDDIDIYGYGIGQQESTFDSLESLNIAYNVKMVEDGEQLIFGRYQDHTGETLTDESLGASNDFDELPDIVSIFSKQDFDIPLRVDVSYINSSDLKPATQSAPFLSRRGNGDPLRQIKTILKVSLSIVMTKDKARQIAYAILWNTLLARHTFPVHTTTRNIRFTPGDVLDLQTDVGTYTIRIVEAVMENMTIIRWTAYLENVSVYDSSGYIDGEIGVTDGTVTPPILSVQDNVYKLVNMPCLDKVGFDDWGFYFFVSPVINVTNWLGAYLFMKSNNQDGYDSISDIIRAITAIGFTVDVSSLRTAPMIGTWDDGSELTVEIQTSSGLKGNSKEGILQGHLVNHLLVGEEIIAFTSIESIGNYQFTLSGSMLRGRFGTENKVNTHVNGERVILLQDLSWALPGKTHFSKSNRISLDKTFMNRTLDLKVVGSQQDEGDASNEEFLNTSLAKKPMAPANIRSRRDGDGTWYIEWNPRGRHSADAWAGGFPQVTTEQDNRFLLEFYSDSNYTSLVFKETVLLPDNVCGYYELTEDRILDEYGWIPSQLFLQMYSVSLDYTIQPDEAGNSDPVRITLGV